MWAQRDDDAWTWRVALTPISSPTSEPQAFASLEAAVQFLTQEMAQLENFKIEE